MRKYPEQGKAFNQCSLLTALLFLITDKYRVSISRMVPCCSCLYQCSGNLRQFNLKSVLSLSGIYKQNSFFDLNLFSLSSCQQNIHGALSMLNSSSYQSFFPSLTQLSLKLFLRNKYWGFKMNVVNQSLTVIVVVKKGMQKELQNFMCRACLLYVNCV